MKICRGIKSQLIVLNQVVTNPWCGLGVIFCGYISHLIGHETINIPEIFSGVHSFTGKTVTYLGLKSPFLSLCAVWNKHFALFKWNQHLCFQALLWNQRFNLSRLEIAVLELTKSQNNVTNKMWIVSNTPTLWLFQITIFKKLYIMR